METSILAPGSVPSWQQRRGSGSSAEAEGGNSSEATQFPVFRSNAPMNESLLLLSNNEEPGSAAHPLSDPGSSTLQALNCRLDAHLDLHAQICGCEFNRPSPTE